MAEVPFQATPRGPLTRTAFRVPFFIPGGIALLAGLDAALALLGLPHVVVGTRLADVHGPLMVLGFVGTVISLERSVALGKAWGYLAPALSGLGAIAVVSVLPFAVGAGLLTVAQVLAVLVYWALYARQPMAAVAVQILGSLMAFAGALLWLTGVPVPAIMPWLVGYLVLTIFGERLELARLDALSVRDGYIAQAIAALFVVAGIVSLLAPGLGFALLGVALLAAAGWLAAKDVARRTIRATGLPRFIAGCLLIGYAWLAVAGAVWLLGGQVEGRGYDAAAHAVFLGFVISMIMAHAPVIMPAVLRRPLPYHPVFIVPAVLLHVTLVLRLAVGDARDVRWAVEVGGVGNIVALLLFVVIVVWSVVTGPRHQPQQARRARRAPRTTESGGSLPVATPVVPESASLHAVPSAAEHEPGTTTATPSVAETTPAPDTSPAPSTTDPTVPEPPDDADPAHRPPSAGQPLNLATTRPTTHGAS